MTDAELIAKLGGAARVAEMLGYPKPKGVARVHNWTVRGIPPGVKLARPDLFLPSLVAHAAQTAQPLPAGAAT